MNKNFLKIVFFSVIGVSFVFIITVVITDRYSIEAKLESNLKVLYRYDLPKVRKVRNDTNVINIRNDTNKVYPDETMRCENNQTKLPEKTIVIVPYRSRLNNLKLFLSPSPLHKHLMNQENPNTSYLCNQDPTLLSAYIEKFKYKLPYQDYFGGVVSMKLNQFVSINGMSNRFWGWGGEDDDLFARLKIKGYTPTHIANNVGRFKSLQHQQNLVMSKDRHKLLNNTKARMHNDGLNQTRYQVAGRIETELFTKITVNLSYKEHLDQNITLN